MVEREKQVLTGIYSTKRENGEGAKLSFGGKSDVTLGFSKKKKKKKKKKKNGKKN